ncbi:innexin shaking-B-like [Cephus cinctus]|uniref:Innexin n=1 Tax=Cephus cinctus TaxID=211228 RepID=A0AAJ7C2F4_CEPCN|nr:innexin shaking-B-like [Cephus cinctus]
MKTVSCSGSSQRVPCQVRNKVEQVPRKNEQLNRRSTRSKTKSRDEARAMDVFRGLYFLSQVSRIKSDNFVSRLHVLTAALLLTFSITVTTRQTVGNPIDCVHTREIPVEVFNAYCWVHSTYIVTGAMLGVVGVNVAFPGVGPSLHQYPYRNSHHHQEQDDRVRMMKSLPKQIKYYQWVAFTLFFQVNDSQ